MPERPSTPDAACPMTLKQLEAFYWAATCASFAVAAQRVHLSMSSLSKRIAELELSLGERLFDRSGHRATLTDTGRRLVPRARDLLQAADALRHDLGQHTGLHGTCRLGVGELSALTWLPRLVRRVQADHPALQLEPHVDIGEVLERRIEAGELDLAVVAGRSSRSAIASQAVAEARFVWCAQPALVGRARSFGPALLGQSTLVTLPPGAGTTRILEDWLAAHDVQPRQRLHCNHWGAVAGMLVEGVGVGLLPQGWARALSRRGLLRSLRSQPEVAALAYTCQWRRDDHRALVRSLRELVVQVADFGSGGLFQ